MEEASGTVFDSLKDILEMNVNSTNKMLLESNKACLNIKSSSLLITILIFSSIIL